jgi:hypothetical protein
MLKDPSEDMKARLQGSRLTEAMLDKDVALAQQIKQKGEAAEGVAPAAAVPHAEVDYWDGINLFLLGHIIDVFESGHEEDPAIPRLVPNALRGYFRLDRGKAAASAANGPSPQGEAAGAAAKVQIPA